MTAHDVIATTILKQNDNFLTRLHPDDHALLMRWVNGEETPAFAQPGRNGWLVLSHPFAYEEGGTPVTIRALKLKGIGLRDHRGVVTPPQESAYTRIHQHLTFDPQGEFALRPSAPDALGGMTETRAYREYDNAQCLTAAHAPSAVHVLLARINNKKLGGDNKGEHLAVAVTAVPSACSERLDMLFDPDLFTNPDKRAVLHTWLPAGSPLDEAHRFTAAASLFRGAGAALLGFHSAGLYRHSGHFNNFGVPSDASGHVYLTDLDSSLPQKELAKTNAGLYVIRDLASLYYGLIALASRKKQIPITRQHRQEIDGIFTHIAEGYFPNLPSASIQEFVKGVGKCFDHVLEDAQARHARHPDVTPEALQGMGFAEQRKASFEQYWLDRIDVYSALIYGISKLYTQAKPHGLPELYMTGPTLARLIENAETNRLCQAGCMKTINTYFPASLQR